MREGAGGRGQGGGGRATGKGGADRQREGNREMHRGADREKRDWNIGEKR